MSEQPRKVLEKTIEQMLADVAPWKPPANIPPEVIGAMQAINRGDALGHQQQLALNYILELSRNKGAHFFPGDGGRRDTDFALGRAFVGEQILAILNIKPKRGGENA